MKKNTKVIKSVTSKGIRKEPLVEDFRKYVESHGPFTSSFVEVQVLTFSKDLSILITESKKRITNSKSNHRLKFSKDIPKSSINKACVVLGISIDEDGLIDMALAKSNRRALAREYHPDYNKHRPSSREKYEEVMDAYSLLESYQLSKTGE